MNDIHPIFIAGCGRSGTTLLRFVLNCNGEIFIPNYIKVQMNDLFGSSFIQDTINCFCDEKITVSAAELSQKSNSN
jgi:hypothetical protein